MWFGTDIGLTHFDGYRFKNFTIKDSLPDNNIIDLHYDSRQRLWITSKAGLCYFKGNKFYTLDFIGDKSIGKITSFLETQSGNILLSVGDQLLLLSPDLDEIIWTSEQAEIPLSNPTVQFQDDDDFIWLYGGDHYLVSLKEGVENMLNLQFIPCADVPFHARKIGQDIYYNSESGLVKIDLQKAKLINIPGHEKAKSIQETEQQIIFPTDSSNSCMQDIFFILADQKGKIWVKDHAGGFKVIGGHFIESDFPTGTLATDVYEDTDNNLWFATQNDGVYFLDAASYAGTNTMQVFLKENVIKSISIRNQKTIVSTNKQVYTSTISGNWETFNSYPIYASSNGDNPLLSNKEFLFTMDQPDVHYHIPDVQAMATTSDSLFFGTTEQAMKIALQDLQKISNKKIGSHFVNLSKYATAILTDRIVNAIHIDKQGVCWLGTDRGLHRYFDGHSTQYRDQDIIFGHNICAIDETADGVLWIGTKGAGVIGLKDNEHLNINSTSQLNHDYCTDLVAEHDVVWVSTSNGINQIADIDFKAGTYQVNRSSNHQAFPVSDISCIAVNDQKVLAGTSKGMLQIDKAYFEGDQSVEEVFITGVSIDNKESEIKKEYNLKYKQNIIQIHFAGVNYGHQNNIMYAYKMSGVNDTLVRTHQPGTPQYVLPPGNYTFEVYALNGNDGKISKPTTIEINKDYPFWDTNLFRILMLCLITGLLFLIVRTYLEAQKTQELERLVAQKTVDLNAKIGELERSNNELEQFNYVVAHDLKAPLRTMFGFLQLLKRTDGESISGKGQEYMDFIGKSVHRLQAMIEDLLLFSGLRVKESKKTSVNLNESMKMALENLHQAIKDTDAQIELISPLPSISANNSEMLQVFQNLIGNGIKYQPPERKPVISIDCEQKDERWTISVKDNGIGIGKQYEEKVFRIFQRLHNQEEYSGTGIGLPICKKIIESYGGEIWLESQPDKGTTFFFTVYNELKKPLKYKS